jgi:hypothetical protein
VDFIERIVGFSPDNGNGTFELLLFMIPIIGILVIVRWQRGWLGRRR